MNIAFEKVHTGVVHICDGQVDIHLANFHILSTLDYRRLVWTRGKNRLMDTRRQKIRPRGAIAWHFEKSTSSQ